MVNIKDENLLFYDIEVFAFDSLVIFKDVENQVVASFWSKGYQFYDEPNGFEDVAKVIKGKVLCGYNNRFYDDKVLSLMMRGIPQKGIKKLNDRLISGDPCNDFKVEGIASIDCMQQIDISHPSLKLIEGNMGKSIIESSIDFNLNRPLTEAEKKEVFDYCAYDIESTIAIYKLRKYSYFQSKQEIVNMLGNDNAMNWNTTTISGNALLSKPLPKWNRLRIPADKWKNVQKIPDEAWNLWQMAEMQDQDAVKGKKIEAEIFEMAFVFGFGGLHGSSIKGREFRNVLLLDVGSMYPSIIILLNALGYATGLYDNIRKERLAIKHTDAVKSAALKLILNSVYGLLKNRYSVLYNPLASATVCIYGQMALFDLCRELYDAGYQLINANTDGIAFTDPNPDDPKRDKNSWDQIARAWESKWGLSLDLDSFKYWYQKDVNNYVAVTDDGKIKVKGGDVNKYHCNPEKGVHRFFSNNNARIVHIGLVEAIVNKKSPVDTILEHINEPILYQYVLRAGGTFEGVFDKEDNQMQKINRVFACRDSNRSTKLYKKRADGGLVCFPDSPDQMFVYNGDLSDFKAFQDVIDYNHYISLIRKKMESWGL